MMHAVLKLGASVRVIAAVEGFGGALDRYGVVTKVSIAHLKAFVCAPTHEGWVRAEDLVRVR